MNNMLCGSAAMNCTAFDENFVQNVVTDIESAYTTVPTAVVKPTFQRPDEEELHTSFEEAISDRLLALHPRLDRISQSLPRACNLTQVQELGEQLKQVTKQSLNVNTWQRITNLACFALMFMLTGFDLMGLLVLHMH